jgi:hypothetical protein
MINEIVTNLDHTQRVVSSNFWFAFEVRNNRMGGKWRRQFASRSLAIALSSLTPFSPSFSLLNADITALAA